MTTHKTPVQLAVFRGWIFGLLHAISILTASLLLGTVATVGVVVIGIVVHEHISRRIAYRIEARNQVDR